jgi:hypothetical protein
MESADETRLGCLLVSSKDPSYLKSVVSMLHEHGIQSEEGLHRPWRSDSFESSVMVAPEDFSRASVLYKESGIALGTGPTLVSCPPPSRPTEHGKRSFMFELFAKAKQPESTDVGRSWKNRA